MPPNILVFLWIQIWYKISAHYIIITLAFILFLLRLDMYSADWVKVDMVYFNYRNISLSRLSWTFLTNSQPWKRWSLISY